MRAGKLLRQMAQRGWSGATSAAVLEGERRPARNRETGRLATRYIHPATRRSVVIDDETGEVIHVGGDGFLY